jgi:TRAP-type mannitol/chloroaromatic compound transport system permease small subunit
MLNKFCEIIDTLNERTGRIVAWLIIPLLLIVTYDVVMRYIFNRPTVWAWDINVQLLGASVALGGGYTLLYNGHIGVDVLVEGLSKRKRAIVEAITSVFFFLGVGVLLWQGSKAAWFSVQTREIDFTYFAPPVYPLKVVIAIGFLLVFLQGIAKLIRDIILIVSREENTP